MFYVYCNAYGHLLFALYLRNKDRQITVVTNYDNIVDFFHRFVPYGKEGREIDAVDVKIFILDVVKRCWVTQFVVDTWQFPEAKQAIERAGVQVVHNVVQKEEYDILKEKLYLKSIKMPHYEVVLGELKELELISGKKVDHPKKGSKDVADAFANANWALNNEEMMEEVPVYGCV